MQDAIMDLFNVVLDWMVHVVKVEVFTFGEYSYGGEVNATICHEGVSESIWAGFSNENVDG